MKTIPINRRNFIGKIPIAGVGACFLSVPVFGQEKLRKFYLRFGYRRPDRIGMEVIVKNKLSEEDIFNYVEKTFQRQQSKKPLEVFIMIGESSAIENYSPVWFKSHNKKTKHEFIEWFKQNLILIMARVSALIDIENSRYSYNYFFVQHYNRLNRRFLRL